MKPKNKYQKGLDALHDYTAGRISVSRLLKIMEWPNRKEILKHIAEKKKSGKRM